VWNSHGADAEIEDAPLARRVAKELKSLAEFQLGEGRPEEMR